MNFALTKKLFVLNTAFLLIDCVHVHSLIVCMYIVCVHVHSLVVCMYIV